MILKPPPPETGEAGLDEFGASATLLRTIIVLD